MILDWSIEVGGFTGVSYFCRPLGCHVLVASLEGGHGVMDSVSIRWYIAHGLSL